MSEHYTHLQGRAPRWAAEMFGELQEKKNRKIVYIRSVENEAHHGERWKSETEREREKVRWGSKMQSTGERERDEDDGGQTLELT